MPPEGGALEDIAREAIVPPMASKSTQPTLEVADSESDDNASWSVCSPRSAKPRPLQGGLALQPWKPSGPSRATKRASDLLIPSNSPCLPGAFPKPRAAAPVHHVGGPACPPPSHWEDRKGAWPPPALAPAVRPRARSLAGPYSLSALASASLCALSACHSQAWPSINISQPSARGSRCTNSKVTSRAASIGESSPQLSKTALHINMVRSVSSPGFRKPPLDTNSASGQCGRPRGHISQEVLRGDLGSLPLALP